jgi:membrane protease YdiL (CAAX protease family)
MRQVYPLFRGVLESDLDFAIYQLGYLPFFVAIEFIFRGFLLFGIYQFRDTPALAGPTTVQRRLAFGYYAVLISMLSYTAWHLGKPQLELWGTIPFGLAGGAIALISRSIWPLVLVHWALNAFLDLAIREGWRISI